MLLALFNHEDNDAAVTLRAGFSPYVDVILIDSGSRLTPAQRRSFDLALPNVHYCGMLNAVYEATLSRPEDEIVYIACTDLRFADFATTVALAAQAFEDPTVGIYAPSVVQGGSGHGQMIHRPGQALRRERFVEMNCWAFRLSLLRAVCPIDTAINRIGWGLDYYMAYLAYRQGLDSVVDHRLCIYHPQLTRYGVSDARVQFDDWFSSLGNDVKHFQRMLEWRIMRTPLGPFMLRRAAPVVRAGHVFASRIGMHA